MTIRKKIYIAGIVVFLIFVISSVIHIRMHQRVLKNLKIRDQVHLELSEIEEFAKWKNNLFLMVSEMVSSGHVPPYLRNLFEPPSGANLENGKTLASRARILAGLIQEKELEETKTEKRFEDFRNEINDIYYNLDERLSTILAVIQMDQVMGKEAPEKSSLAPFVLKTLNQLTLITLNSLMARNFTENDLGIIAKNRSFLSSQLQIIDEDGTIRELFDQLFAKIKALEKFLPETQSLSSRHQLRIDQSKRDFDELMERFDTSHMVEAAEAEVMNANADLQKESLSTLLTAIFFLIAVPVVIVAAGLFSLKRMIIEPIDALSTAMKSFESGSYQITSPVVARDEIGGLAQAFNIMAAEIYSRVTEMERLNRTLKENESKYRTLVENIPQSIYLKNRDFVYVSCNNHFANTVRKKTEEIIGKSDYELFSKKWADRYRDEDERIFLSETQEELEELYYSEGREKFIYKINIPVRDEKGFVTGVLGIFSNITDRKQAEEERERLVAAIEHTNDSIMITDIEGIIRYVNPSFEKITGYEGDDVIGKSTSILKSGRHDADFYRSIWDTISSGGTWQGKLVNKRKDNTIFIEEASISPVFDARGKIVNYVAVKRDITEQMKIEEMLRQAQKMEAIGTLAGGIAHDFNNILFPIIGLSELTIEDLPPDSQLTENLQDILKAGKRGAELVKQILSFSRQTEQEKLPVRIQKILHETYQLTRSSIPSYIDIEMDIQEDCGLVIADPVQIHQIAMNLITNAYHATEKKGGRIYISLKERQFTDSDDEGRIIKPGKYAKITVQDNGTGIDSNVIDKQPKRQVRARGSACLLYMES